MATERIVTRTIVGAQLQTVRQLGLSHEVMEYTTLNQALNEPTIIDLLPNPLTQGMEIADDYDYTTDTENLYTQYVVLGNGGHRNIDNPNDAVPYTLPIPHLATDTGLYNLMAFLVRPVTDDLTPAERGKYRLRRTVMRDGVLYAAYFARKIDFPRTTPDMNITTIVDGEESSEQFVPTINNLRPSHPEESHNYDGTYASVSSYVQLVWDSKEIEDIKEAARILFGNERMAIISEIAICSGVEKPIKQRYPNTGAQVPTVAPANMFFEAVACQVQVHITTYVPISFVDQEYKLNLDIGATEPLFGVTVNG